MTTDAAELLRRDLNGFPPYSVAPLKIADLDRVIKLDTNENPYGPSPKALAALQGYKHWEHYVGQDELRPAIARYAGTDVNNVVVTNGADEAIDLVQRVFLEPGDAIVECTPTFEMYSLLGAFNKARVIGVPRREDFRIDLPAIEQVVSHERPKILFLANPSNPDGTVATRKEIERLLDLPTVVVVDEAYAEFAGESYASNVRDHSNLVVLRTFSKWAGLAGLRIGYCIAPTGVADLILRTKSPYNVSAAALVAAQASLDDAEYLLGNVRRIIAERERLSGELAGTGFLRPLPSCTNFILNSIQGHTGLELRGALAKRGILTRAYDSPRLRDYIRISVGRPEQDDRVVAALKEIGR